MKALGADAFCYMATTHGRLKVAIGELGRILVGQERGRRRPSGSWSIRPRRGPTSWPRSRFGRARRRRPFLSTGIEPGFFSDYLPVVLSGCLLRIDSIRVYELAMYGSGHQSDEVAFAICGFGQPIDALATDRGPGGDVAVGTSWCARSRTSSDVDLDGIETATRPLPGGRPSTTRVVRIEEGTIAGFRFAISGVVDGQTKVVVEHVTRTQRGPSARVAAWSLAGDAYRDRDRRLTETRLRVQLPRRRRPPRGRLQHHRHASGERHPAALRARAGCAVDLRPPAGDGPRACVEVAPSRATWGLSPTGTSRMAPTLLPEQPG